MRWPIKFEVPVYGGDSIPGTNIAPWIGAAVMFMHQDGTIKHGDTIYSQWRLVSGMLDIMVPKSHPPAYYVAREAAKAYERAIAELILEEAAVE